MDPFLTPKLPDGEYHQLCALIGHLFVTFARIEGALASRLKWHLGANTGNQRRPVNMQLASAIYGSQRFAALRDFANRIANIEGDNEKTKSDLANVFQHIGEIQKLRDMIAHQQLIWEFRNLGYRWQIIDAITVKDIKKAKIIGFNEEAIGSAAEDLDAAAHYFGDGGQRLRLFGPDFHSEPPTWRYKPSMLKTLEIDKRTTPQGPKRQPQSSEERSRTPACHQLG